MAMYSTTAVHGQDAREERLVSVLSRARGRARLAFNERWLFTLGGALAVAGVALVIVGWVGTSKTVLVAGQIPYVVSGGLLGLALVFLGGFLYFGYWLSMLVRDGRQRSEQDHAEVARMSAELERANRSLVTIANLLEAGAVAAAAAPSTRRRPISPLAGRERRVTARAARHPLVATPSGTLAHRPDCPVVANRTDIRPVAPDSGLGGCGICTPDL